MNISHWKKGGEWYYSQKTAREMLGISRPTLNNYCNSLGMCKRKFSLKDLITLFTLKTYLYLGLGIHSRLKYKLLLKASRQLGVDLIQKKFQELDFDLSEAVNQFEQKVRKIHEKNSTSQAN